MLCATVFSLCHGRSNARRWLKDSSSPESSVNVAERGLVTRRGAKLWKASGEAWLLMAGENSHDEEVVAWQRVEVGERERGDGVFEPCAKRRSGDIRQR